MHKTFFLISLAVGLYAAIAATVAIREKPRLGYVDSSVLLERFTGSTAAREKLTQQSNEWSSNVKTLQGELAALDQEMQGAPGWSKEVRAQKAAARMQKRDELTRYTRAIESKSAQLGRELMEPVFSDLNAYVKEFGSQRGYSVVFGTVAGGNILYAREGLDVTEEFLIYANDRSRR